MVSRTISSCSGLEEHRRAGPVENIALTGHGPHTEPFIRAVYLYYMHIENVARKRERESKRENCDFSPTHRLMLV